MRARFWENPHFVQHESLLRRLHELMAAGKGDSDEADAVRDQMDVSWRALSREEIARLDGLSADLYMLEGEEVLDPASAQGWTPERLGVELGSAWNQGEWEKVLSLLRNGPSFIPQDRIAYLRARAYEELGHLDASLLFMQYAVRLHPDDLTYDWSVMELLIKLRRYDEAVAAAESQIEHRNLAPGLLIQAASILLRAAKERPGEKNRVIYERAIGVLRGALHSSPQLPPVLVVFGYLTLGFCHEALEQWQPARDAYDRALELRPDDTTVLTARGLLLSKLALPGAVADLERAVAHGTTLIGPYIHLAHDSLIAGDFRRCLELCNRILSLTERPRVLAAALQWAAIAQFELRNPHQVVRQNFLTALGLDPLNHRIRENFERFEQLVRSGTTARDAGMHWPAIEDLDPTLMPSASLSPPAVPLAV